MPTQINPANAGQRVLTVGDGVSEGDPPRSERLLIDIVIEDEPDWSPFGDVWVAVRAAADALAASDGLAFGSSHATIALASDEEVSTLNATYRGQAKPTNVLSFPTGPLLRGAPRLRHRELGDIIIARQTVLAEAADQNIEPAHHLQHLVIHGLLHLLGYDHEDDTQAQCMERLESQILASLGVSDPYADPPAAEA